MRPIDALLHPVAAAGKAAGRLRAALLERGWGDRRFWSRLERELGFSPAERSAWLKEGAELEERLQARWRELGGAWARGGLLEAECRRVLYLLVRAAKPQVMVETGVANGGSSFFVLSAMRRNGGGRLYSFEPPERSPFVPPGREEGWLVTQELRPSWSLIRQNSLEGLEPLFKGLEPVDFFFHDSDHSYEVMSAEYRLAWPHLKPGALLASDDVFFHAAFEEFAAAVGAPAFVWRTRLGILHKAGT